MPFCLSYTDKARALVSMMLRRLIEICIVSFVDLLGEAVVGKLKVVRGDSQ